MEYIDLRKLNRGELKQIRRQVVRLKKMGKTGKEIEELTGIRQCRASEIWTAYQQEGESSLEPKKRGREMGTHLQLTPEEQAENAVIYWGDETGIDNGSNYERGFAPKGQPPVLPVETKRERLNMLSALSREGDIRFMLYEDSMNQQRLIQFMNRLVRTSRQKIFLILDNLRVHHGKKVAAWLDRHRDKIELFFSAALCP